MKFLIESSKTPIYNRIAMEIAKGLVEFGHEVIRIDANESTANDFTKTINKLPADYYIVTNDYNYITRKKTDGKGFLLDEINHKMIFIHHDSSFYKPGEMEEIDSYLSSLIHFKDKIYHFFIEASNIYKFQKIGIEKCFPLLHASEFKPGLNFNKQFSYDISFVGHLMSGLKNYPTETLVMGQHMNSFAWGRFSSSKFPIQKEISRLTEDWILYCNEKNINIHRLSIYQFLMHEITKLSAAYRGELLSTVKNHQVSIIGGDLSYGRINDPLLKLNQDNIIYHPATSDYSQSQSIYETSKISINISSLQFDTAINNRIVDIVMAGGFLISDNRSELSYHCPTTKNIIFDSPEHMNHLIDYYMNPANNKRYLDIKEQIYLEFREVFNYRKTISQILEKIV